MPNDSSAIVSKVWNYAHVLKNAGGGYGDYVEQITYLLFLKLAEFCTTAKQLLGTIVVELTSHSTS